jgi:integral membrane protein
VVSESALETMDALAPRPFGEIAVSGPSPVTLFRRAAVAEAVTWALLLLGMLLKYGTGTTEVGVRVFGMLHGIVFIAYCLTVVFVAVNQRWSLGTTLLGLTSAVPPFLTVWFDRRAERRGDLAGPWRLAPGGESPAGVLERAQAWLLARPVAAAAVAVLAVAALTAVALVAGPPTGSPS